MISAIATKQSEITNIAQQTCASQSAKSQKQHVFREARRNSYRWPNAISDACLTCDDTLSAYLKPTSKLVGAVSEDKHEHGKKWNWSVYNTTQSRYFMVFRSRSGASLGAWPGFHIFAPSHYNGSYSQALLADSKEFSCFLVGQVARALNTHE